MRAVYEEIIEPERIVWTETDNGLRSVSTFVDLGDGRTEVMIEQTNAPEFFLTPQARAGFATSLDRFQSYLQSLHQAEQA